LAGNNKIVADVTSGPLLIISLPDCQLVRDGPFGGNFMVLHATGVSNNFEMTDIFLTESFK